MSYWEVKDYLNQLVNFSQDEEALILPLCKTSLNETEALLRQDADRDDIRIVAAAAGKAYYKLMIRRNNTADPEEISDFKAGDVSITHKNNDTLKQLEKAEKYYLKMLDNLAPLCIDDGFVFIQAQVKS